LPSFVYFYFGKANALYTNVVGNMHGKIVIALLGLLLASCMTAKKVTYYDETIKFYQNVLFNEGTFCSKRINNSYWIKEIEEIRLAAMRKYLDSVGTKTPEDYLEFERRHKFLTIESVSIPQAMTVDYEKVIADLRLTNNMRISQFVKCDSTSAGHISLPIFDKEFSKAVIETEGGTFLFVKVDGRWKFKDRGLLRVF
jgi:hypothetical protein